MLKSILSGYRTLGGSLLKTGAVLGACVLFAFALVYPLWFFATSYPAVYTAAVFAAAALLACVFTALKIRAFFASSDKAERKRKAAAWALRAAKAAVVIAGVCAAVALVFAGKRALSLGAVFVTAALYGVIAFGAQRG